MVVYRISNCQFISDLSGEGAYKYGGRWNSKGVHMLYTAGSAALALLESVVHIPNIINVSYCLAAIEVPAQKIAVIHEEELPADWQMNPPPDHLKKIGNSFIASNDHLVLKIPSVILPQEFNYLINPYHKDFAGVKILTREPLNIDKRLLRQ
jgi:RES domain-containing protein